MNLVRRTRRLLPWLSKHLLAWNWRDLLHLVVDLGRILEIRLDNYLGQTCPVLLSPGFGYMHGLLYAVSSVLLVCFRLLDTCISRISSLPAATHRNAL